MILRRAVVLGASMAGLVAARVLSDHAEEVIVIERDESEATDEPRPGVPQGSQVHALLPAGQAQLDRWFPGFYADAVAAGAIVPQPGSVELYLDGALKVTPPTQTVNPATVSTRPLRRFAAVVGDARQLDQADDSVDVTLLLGPLYHLTPRQWIARGCWPRLPG